MFTSSPSASKSYLSCSDGRASNPKGLLISGKGALVYAGTGGTVELELIYAYDIDVSESDNFAPAFNSFVGGNFRPLGQAAIGEALGDAPRCRQMIGVGDAVDPDRCCGEHPSKDDERQHRCGAGCQNHRWSLFPQNSRGPKKHRYEGSESEARCIWNGVITVPGDSVGVAFEGRDVDDLESLKRRSQPEQFDPMPAARRPDEQPRPRPCRWAAVSRRCGRTGHSRRSTTRTVSPGRTGVEGVTGIAISWFVPSRVMRTVFSFAR